MLLSREYTDLWLETEGWHCINCLLAGCSPCLEFDPCNSEDLHVPGPSPCFGLIWWLECPHFSSSFCALTQSPDSDPLPACFLRLIPCILHLAEHIHSISWPHSDHEIDCGFWIKHLEWNPQSSLTSCATLEEIPKRVWWFFFFPIKGVQEAIFHFILESTWHCSEEMHEHWNSICVPTQGLVLGSSLCLRLCSRFPHSSVGSLS